MQLHYTYTAPWDLICFFASAQTKAPVWHKNGRVILHKFGEWEAMSVCVCIWAYVYAYRTYVTTTVYM